MVLISSNNILQRNGRDLQKIRSHIVPEETLGVSPRLEREEEQIPRSDSELEPGLALTNRKQNTERQQDLGGQL